MLHGGRLECTSASCIGAECKPLEYDLNTLHVQDEGFVQFGDSGHMPELQLNLVNFTVSTKLGFGTSLDLEKVTICIVNLQYLLI